MEFSKSLAYRSNWWYRVPRVFNMLNLGLSDVSFAKLIYISIRNSLFPNRLLVEVSNEWKPVKSHKLLKVINNLYEKLSSGVFQHYFCNKTPTFWFTVHSAYHNWTTTKTLDPKGDKKSHVHFTNGNFYRMALSPGQFWIKAEGRHCSERERNERSHNIFIPCVSL